MNNWIIENLGWTLLHSLWQISFISAVLFCVLRIFRDFSANLRYLFSVLALSLSIILPLVTFVYFSNETNQSQLTNQTIQTFSNQVRLQETKKQIVSEKIDVPPMISADKSVSSPSSKINLMPIMVGFWFFGVLFFSIRLLGGIWAVHLYKTREASEVEKIWKEKFDELCENLKIRQKIKFLKSKKVEMPMVIGWLKPVILVPASAFLQISPKELETILIHELIHIKRRDYLVNLLQSLVEILFFYHPCVWWISSKIRAEREFAVDEFISQTFETEKIIYANALATLEEIRTMPSTNLVMAANGGNLMKRIENILTGNRKINSKNVSIWSAVFVVTLILGLMAGLYWIKINDSSKPKSGRKVAVLINAFRNKQGKVEPEHLLQLQTKYKIPSTWIVDGDLIDTLKQNNSARDFFRQAKETNSNFILNIPNMDSTIYIDGLESYIPVWKERIRFVNSNLAEYSDKIRFYTTSSSQLPQPMEDYLKENQISFLPLRERFSGGQMFYHYYEKNCIRIENINEEKHACRDTEESEKREVREKYLQFNREIFEFRSNYSKEKFGVELPQMLNLITNELTKESADELLQMLQNNGYEFVPLEEVTSNDIFKKLENASREHKDFYFKTFEISNKYLDRPFVNSVVSTEILKKADENLKKSFNVDATTKDLKIIEKQP
jgi:beta-lactamase regulating signal transducer with metallopeptidase domain